MKYILALGTNIGDRKQNLEKAIEAINSMPYTDVKKCSSIYETQPVGYAKQDDFYNLVCLVESKFNPHEILGACMGIEAGFGRIRSIKNGPRILDIDLIFAEDEKIDTQNLQVPHPRYHERRFVLEPLLELIPEGEFFGFYFKNYIQKIEGQWVQIADKINDDLLA